jgi:hypothetical protein
LGREGRAKMSWKEVDGGMGDIDPHLLHAGSGVGNDWEQDEHRALSVLRSRRIVQVVWCCCAKASGLTSWICMSSLRPPPTTTYSSANDVQPRLRAKPKFNLFRRKSHTPSPPNVSVAALPLAGPDPLIDIEPPFISSCEPALVYILSNKFM